MNLIHLEIEKELKSWKENEGNSWIFISWLWKFRKSRINQALKISPLNTKLMKCGGFDSKNKQRKQKKMEEVKDEEHTTFKREG